MKQVDSKKLPRHIAIIMDGNGRWAKKRGLPRIFGHRQGAKSVERVVRACAEMGIEVLTLYAFSTENWARPKKEIKALMSLLGQFLDEKIAELKKNNIKLRTIGNIGELPEVVQKKLKQAIRETEKNSRLTLNLALNYGSRTEIIEAVKRISELVKAGELSPAQIDEKVFSEHLYTAGIPDPDLLIRTSGESRLSNFLLWQISYTEIYVTRTLWPDFRKSDLLKAIADFQHRRRRFVGILDE